MEWIGGYVLCRKMEKYEALLVRVKETIDKHPEYVVNSEYNIFRVLRVQGKEVLMCRFLADLLSPNGEHGQGILFLKSFFENILDIHGQSDKQLQETKIIKEYAIDANVNPRDAEEKEENKSKRRIDIVLSNAEHFIPIEAKIYAEDQDTQCFDYYNYAKAIDAQTCMVYLTRFHELPSEKSRKNLSDDQIKCIGWTKDIAVWIEKSMDQVNDDGVKHILRQYVDAIHEIADERCKEKMDKCMQLVMESPENLEAALCLEKVMNKAKVKVMHLLFQELEDQMEEMCKRYTCLHKEEDRKYYYYKNKENDGYYNYDQKSTFPGINYVVAISGKEIFSNKNLQLWFRIEIEHDLFAGFCVFDTSLQGNEEYSGYEVSKIDKNMVEDFSHILNIPVCEGDYWWVTWIYSNGKDKEDESVPNFKTMNRAAIALVDEGERKAFVKNALDHFEEHLLKKISVK